MQIEADWPETKIKTKVEPDMGVRKQCREREDVQELSFVSTTKKIAWIRPGILAGLGLQATTTDFFQTRQKRRQLSSQKRIQNS